MRRALLVPVLAAVLALTGCGQDQTGEVTDESPTHSQPSGSPEDEGDEGDKEPEGQVDFELAEMVTETAVDGRVDPMAIPFGDETAVHEFSAQFENDNMRIRLLTVVDRIEVPDGQALYGAVVAIGCQVPPGVVVTNTDSGLEITGKKSIEPPVQCIAPMTTVALVLVDESVVG